MSEHPGETEQSPKEFLCVLWGGGGGGEEGGGEAPLAPPLDPPLMMVMVHGGGKALYTLGLAPLYLLPPPPSTFFIPFIAAIINVLKVVLQRAIE